MIDPDTAEKIGRIDANVRNLDRNVANIAHIIGSLSCADHSARIDTIEKWQAEKAKVVDAVKSTAVKTIVSAMVGGAIVYIATVVRSSI